MKAILIIFIEFLRCPEDETLKIEKYGSGQKLSFQSFKFAHSEDAFLYLHCDILACTSSTSCGTCIKKWRDISALWIRNWNNRIRKQMVFDVTTIQRELAWYIFLLLSRGQICFRQRLLNYTCDRTFGH